jgi:integrase
MPSGSKYWRMKYFFAGKERLLALGVYPEVSLSDARERHLAARKVLAKGRDPNEVKREEKQGRTLNALASFESVAREWLSLREHEWRSKTFRYKKNRLEGYVFPKLGARPIAEIKATEVLDMLRSVEKRGTLELTRRISQMTGQVFSYAVATGRAERNPVPDLRGALKTPVVRHHSYLKEAELPEFFRQLAAYDGHPVTRYALQLLFLTFVRTTELRAATWDEINFEKREWRIPAERMKMKEVHIVSLSDQALELLIEIKVLTGNRVHVFPNQHRPTTFMSENAMLYALYRMGYHSRATGHGVRSTASTILNENGFSPDVIERQLAHSERNAVRAAYNYAQYLPERKRMMQWWADFLDRMKDKGQKAT